MKLGIVIYSNDPETVWNAFRLANFSINKSDEVKVFFLGRGVETEFISTEHFNINDQIKSFVEKNGKIYSCGSCLKIRQTGGTHNCPISTMQDLYDIISSSDKIISF